jgi:hypothetical protein
MTTNEIVDAITLALTTGVNTGATEIAKKAIVESYEGLKSLFVRKHGENSHTVKAIRELETKPKSKGRKDTLTEELEEIHAASDPELTAAVQSLLNLIQSLPRSEEHIQSAHGTGIAQADRCSTATVTMTTPAKQDA